MPAIEPTAPAHAELHALLDDEPGVELRPMFGTLAALVGGHVFAVAMGDVIGVKLAAETRAELGAMPGSDVLMMGNRQMRAYRSIPASLPAAERRSWLIRARDYIADGRA